MPNSGFYMEHILMMFIAVTLITVGYRMSKQGTQRKCSVLSIGLIVIIAAILWPFRTVSADTGSNQSETVRQ
jgi:hypothetical protein